MTARIAALLVVLTLAAAWPVPAPAQESALDFIMRELQRRGPDRGAGPQPVRRAAPEIASSSARVTELPKHPNAQAILVIGDAYADGLRQGLSEVFAGEVMARIVGQGRAGLSIARDGADDLLRLLRAGIEEHRPAAVVVIAGLGDREPIVENGVPNDIRSDRWKELYSGRIEAVMRAAQAARVPIYWVGQPPQRNRAIAQDIAHVNDVARAQAFSSSARFVDIWEGFVDEAGAYIAVGPDVNGMQRRLRTADGIGMTPAGNRKMGFFVATELRRDLTFEVPNQAPAPGTEDAPPIAAPAPQPGAVPEPARPFVGPVLSLTQPAVVRGVDLMGGPRPVSETPDDPAARVLARGVVPDARPGRADDFTWPPAARARPPGL